MQGGQSLVRYIAGSKRYSKDLPQGGLEVPCLLRFEGDMKVTERAKELIESAFSSTAVDLVTNKRRKVSNAPKILLDSDEERSPVHGDKGNGSGSEKALCLPLQIKIISWPERNLIIVTLT